MDFGNETNFAGKTCEEFDLKISRRMTYRRDG
jgi:hypothetical protein